MVTIHIGNIARKGWSIPEDVLEHFDNNISNIVNLRVKGWSISIYYPQKVLTSVELGVVYCNDPENLEVVQYRYRGQSVSTTKYTAVNFYTKEFEPFVLCVVTWAIWIFVGGLDHTVSDEDLKQPFTQYGEIVSVKILIGKGFGLAQFPAGVMKALPIESIHIKGSDQNGYFQENLDVIGTVVGIGDVVPVNYRKGLQTLQVIIGSSQLKAIQSINQVTEMRQCGEVNQFSGTIYSQPPLLNLVVVELYKKTTDMDLVNESAPRFDQRTCVLEFGRTYCDD
ncbi:RNA-binding protein 47C [Artemisia annua]|uniref:RNA-binding protein 47C n=1 Tax=Artemisia annua TaxID=35608 RepID=A0A2U1KSG0_ARTAN|nr:RNA-binding protein 47C [Artemisia annua]